MNSTTAVSHSETMVERSLPVTERFNLHDFFRAPGLRYDSREDLTTKLEHQQQQKTLSSVDEAGNQQNLEELVAHKDEHQVQSNQHLTPHSDQNTAQDEDPKDTKEWAGFPYMDTEHYGYRLCSLKELTALKKESEMMRQRCVRCSKFCC